MPLRTSRLSIAAALLLAASIACQQGPKVGRSPIRVELGVVRAGAIVETTVFIYWRAPANNAKVITKLPPTIQQLTIESNKDDQGREETRLALAIATDQLGKHETSIELSLGERKASIPVIWTVAPAVPNSSRILVASTPFRGDSSMLPEDFASWRDLIVEAQLDVDYRHRRKGASTFSTESLARVDIVLVGEECLLHITNSEVARLQGFICGGGRIVVFADAFFVGTAAAANRICEPFGIEVINREPPIGEPHAAFDGDLARHALNVGVKRIVVGRPSPTKITNPELATALVTLPTFGSEYPFASIATTKSGGEIIAVGNSLWWNWIAKAPGNKRLLRNLLVRAPRLR